MQVIAKEMVLGEMEEMLKEVTYEEVKGVVKPAKFICKGCGRVAAKAINLCDPELL